VKIRDETMPRDLHMKIRGATAPKCQENLIDALNAVCASHTQTHSCISTTQSRSGQPEETVPHGDSLRFTCLITESLKRSLITHHCIISSHATLPSNLQLHFHLQTAIFLEEVTKITSSRKHPTHPHLAPKRSLILIRSSRDLDKSGKLAIRAGLRQGF
jgi:hypothetical protein